MIQATRPGEVSATIISDPVTGRFTEGSAGTGYEFPQRQASMGRTPLEEPLAVKPRRDSAMRVSPPDDGRGSGQQSSDPRTLGFLQQHAGQTTADGRGHAAEAELPEDLLALRRGVPEGQPAFSTMSKEGSPAEGTARVSRTLPATETAPPAVDQLVRTAAILRREGRTEMHVRLEPPTLGWVRVSVRASGDSLTLGINAERAGTQALLSHAIGELQQALASQGLDVASVTVRLDLGLARDRSATDRPADRPQRDEPRERNRARARASAPDPLSHVDLII